jgi:hypothetical protein
MIRVTVHEKSGARTFQVEGSLAGPSVPVLEECWRNTLAGQRIQVCLDLTDVTFIDAEGQACLAVLQQQGAEFIAADCLTKAIVAEISQDTKTNASRNGSTESAKEDHP